MQKTWKSMIVVCTIATSASVCTSASAQHQPMFPRGEMMPRHIDSGFHANLGDAERIVHSDLVAVPGSSWIRLYFEDIMLERGSRIRYTSLHDGEVQELDAAGVAMWSNTSAYFNGEMVLIELIAAPGTENNRFILDQIAVEIGAQPFPLGHLCGICDGDTRTPSDEPWAGRLMPVGCSAGLYSSSSCTVSAGHCMQNNLVMQFNVPNSSSNCNPNNPPVADQFPVTQYLFQNSGVGGDWAVLTLGTNNQGQTAYERQGEYRPIASSPAPNNSTAHVWGYGLSHTCTVSQTQQHAQGQIRAVNSNHYRIRIDVTYGNSGSPVIYNDEIIGIITHCDPQCSFFGNYAQRVDVPGFVNARDQLCDETDSCPWDFNGDGVVDGADLGQLLANWGPCSDCNNCPWDVNDDCTVDGADLGQVLANWGDCPDPPGNFCAGHCGSQAPEGCWCDAECEGFGDCCPDVCDDCPNLPFCDSGGLCAGHCGGQAPEGCWCDDQCEGFGDCCPDVCDDCPNLPFCDSGGLCAGHCGGQAPEGCWCDAECQGFGDCCPDVCNDCPNLPFC